MQLLLLLAKTQQCGTGISALQCVTVHISWCKSCQGGQTLQLSIKQLQAASKRVFSKCCKMFPSCLWKYWYSVDLITACKICSEIRGNLQETGDQIMEICCFILCGLLSFTLWPNPGPRHISCRLNLYTQHCLGNCLANCRKRKCCRNRRTSPSKLQLGHLLSIRSIDVMIRDMV